MPSTARSALLAAYCGGALLVGIELMITAIVLPRIVVDLADWTQLRRASWVVNGYLVAYIATMPLAGRLSDRFGPGPPLIVALATFALGSLLAGFAQSLDQLIAARLLQGAGGGAILPLATAGASHLFRGTARARALGLVGACTFLGMAMGPFLGASVLSAFEMGPALRAAGLGHSAAVDLLAPSWRWVFLLGAPAAITVLAWVWAAAPAESRTGAGSIDLPGAGLFTGALVSGLVAVTLIGEPSASGTPVPLVAASIAIVMTIAVVAWSMRTVEPFVDLRLLRDRVFGSAVLVSLLTGYALATAIIGAAVWVDRVRYAGHDEQRVVLGTLALTMAVGALGSGLVLRSVRVVPLTLVGLALAMGGTIVMGTADRAAPMERLLVGLALFGVGFGMTVTPRSTAAVEALGRGAFGMASAGVTVARTVGMAIGLAVLTGFGTQRIEALSVVLTDGGARDAVLPPELRGRVLEDPAVVAAVERWAAGEAAAILAALFLVATLVLAIAALPTLLMGGPPGRAKGESIRADGAHDGLDDQAPALAL